MHLYPLCALRCVPLPWWSPAHWRRALLLHDIDRHSMILANAGSERAAGAHAPVTLQKARNGIRVTGTYEYMSLAHVADVVLFTAPLAGSRSTMFCAANLAGPSVRIGASRFRGSMSLSDTCAVTFQNHHVASHRFIRIPNEGALNCMAHYQRSWFQLLLGEAYLARLDFLQSHWDLPRSAEQYVSLNELERMREYALRLLNEATPGAIESLARVTAAMKLRTSWRAQSTAGALKGIDDTAAAELGHLRLQPTSDARILESLVPGASRSSPQLAGLSPRAS